MTKKHGSAQFRNPVPLRGSYTSQDQLIITAQTLKLLMQNKTIKSIAHTRKTSTRNIRKLYQKYKREGLINAQRELTKSGAELVKKAVPFLRVVSNSAVPPQTLRLHDLQFNVGILKKPKKWDEHRSSISKLKKYKPTQWQGNTGALFQEFVIDNIKVRVTPNSILIKPPDIFDVTPNAAMDKAVEMLYAVLPKIENLFNIILEKDRKLNITIGREHFAYIFNPIAKHCLENKTPLRIRDEKGELRVITDDSHGLCELEFIHPRHAEDDAQAFLENYIEDITFNKPFKPSEVSALVSKIAQTTEEIAAGQLNNTRTIQSLLNIVKAQAPVETEQGESLPETQTRLKGYR